MSGATIAVTGAPRQASREAEGLRTYALAFLAWTLANMDQQLLAFAIPDVARDFGVSLPTIAQVITVSFLLGGVLCVGIGMLADLKGRRIALALALGGCALFVGLQAAATGIAMLGLIRLLGFGFSAGLSPICATLVAENTVPRWRLLAVAVLQCAYPIGAYLGARLAALLLAADGWQALFRAGLVVVPLAGLVYVLLPQSADEMVTVKRVMVPRSWRTHLSLLWQPGVPRLRLVAMSLTFFAFGGAAACCTIHMPGLLIASRGYTDGSAAEIWGRANFTAIAGFPLGAITAMLIGRRRLVASATMALAAMVLGLFLWSDPDPGADLAILSLVQLLFAAASAILIAHLVDSFPGEIRVTGGAICGGLAVNLGLATVPALLVLLRDQAGWNGAFTATAVPALLLAAVALLCTPSNRLTVPRD